MRAVWFEEFGSAKSVLQLGDQPAQQPAGGEVLVELHTSGVNPSDVKKRAGAFPDLLDGGLIIPNSDGAGVIRAVGEGVDAGRIGQRVWVYQAQYGRRLGTLAEQVCVASEHAPELPDEASFEVGACLGIPVMTAHRCVFADGPVSGQTLLITGGAGRVGYYAIQWASQAGARVIATASSESDRQDCLDAGATAVVNHRSEEFAAAVLDANQGQPVDRVIDVEFGANLETVLEVIRIGGTIATYSSTQVPQPTLPFVRMMFMDLTIRLVIVYAMPEEAKLAAIADTNQALREGRLKHRVAHVLPLGEAAKANELIEQGGFRGCVVVDVTA